MENKDDWELDPNDFLPTSEFYCLGEVYEIVENDVMCGLEEEESGVRYEIILQLDEFPLEIEEGSLFTFYMFTLQGDTYQRILMEVFKLKKLN